MGPRHHFDLQSGADRFRRQIGIVTRPGLTASRPFALTSNGDRYLSPFSPRPAPGDPVYFVAYTGAVHADLDDRLQCRVLASLRQIAGDWEFELRGPLDHPAPVVDAHFIDLTFSIRRRATATRSTIPSPSTSMPPATSAAAAPRSIIPPCPAACSSISPTAPAPSWARPPPPTPRRTASASRRRSSASTSSDPTSSMRSAPAATTSSSADRKTTSSRAVGGADIIRGGGGDDEIYAAAMTATTRSMRRTRLGLHRRQWRRRHHRRRARRRRDLWRRRNDTIRGGRGWDYIEGNGGDDNIDGGRGDPTMIHGGAAAELDTITRRASGDDVIIEWRTARRRRYRRRARQ